MTSNPELLVQQLQHEFQHLLAYVTGPEARSQTAYPVELTLFRRLLGLGAALLRLFCVTRAAVRPTEPVTAPAGTRLPSHDQRPTTDSSVFGKVGFERPDVTSPGQPGRCPLDAELSLPAGCDSDRLREWALYGTTAESSRESQTGLARILGRPLSVPALETGVADAAADVAGCYAPPAEPTAPPPVGAMRVVHADGQGVPLVQPSPQKPPGRLGTGQKRGKKKEAVVTGLYTIAPYPRTPQEVVAALLPDSGGPPPAPHPPPVDNELRATLAGTAVAMRQLAQRAAQREGPQSEQRVALTEGAEALQQQLVTHVPADTVLLDILHATESLWDAAHALLGEPHPQRLAWVRAYLEALVAGQTDAVSTALEAAGQDPTCTGTQRPVVRRTVGDYQRNRPYRHDDAYLARGWPIGTGVVEGACGHLGKDRMEQSGRRWTTAGAQAVLDLRAVRINGHWEAYGQGHRQQHHQRLADTSAPAPATVEAQALTLAAESNRYPRSLVTLK